MSLILGTVQFGLPYGITNYMGQPLRADIFSILDSAWEFGTRILDSAQGYGEANDVISDYHRDRMQRFHVVNKVLRYPENEDMVIESLQRERDAMMIDSFDCVMFHFSDSVTEEIHDNFFARLKDLKLAARSGLSIETPVDYYKLSRRFLFDVVQLPSNPLNQEFVTDDFLADLKDNNIEIHARSAFLQGILLTDSTNLPHYLHPLQSLISRFQKDCAAQRLSPLAGCLLYNLQRSAVDHIVVGAQNMEQWQEIIVAYRQAKALMKDNNFVWMNYACKNFDLVHPSQWAKLNNA